MSRYKILPCSGNSQLRVGILGGTFNPAHEGHRYISLEAIKRLHLDYVIWLVSPHNPLKTLNVIDSLPQRVEIAKLTKSSNKILVSDIEKYFKTNFTVNSIQRIKHMHPGVEFIWIMGADNMLQIHRWYSWKRLFEQVYIAIFDRENYKFKIIKSKAACNFPRYHILHYPYNQHIRKREWCFFRIKSNPLSSTQIRNNIKNDQYSPIKKITYYRNS